MRKDELALYTIYDHPTDSPDNFVVRKWLIDSSGVPKPDEKFLVLSDKLETCREMLQVSLGLFCLGRERDDDPKIVESWI